VHHGDPAEQEQRLEARRRSQEYVERFVGPDGAFTSSGLIYVGATGVGKTHLAVAVARELIERYRVRARFVDFTALLFDIQSTFTPGAALSKSDILAPVTDSELLVLDDLGAQKPSGWVDEVLYLILNGRYARRLPTLFTTNYALDLGNEGELDRTPGRNREALGRRISHRLVSRLFEMAEPIEIEVRDFRQEVKVHQHHA
jgi:DNA replication protein DnaC